jgi:hypothetical protein
MEELIESSLMEGRMLFYRPFMFLKLLPSSFSTFSWGKFSRHEKTGLVVAVVTKGSVYKACMVSYNVI